MEHLPDGDAERGDGVARGLHVGTTRYGPVADPGGAEVSFVPNWIEHSDPCGVNWTIRNPCSSAKSASSRQPSRS